jgi:uncharacterized membrane protein YfcA
MPAIGAFAGSALGATAVQFVSSAFLAALVPILLIAMGLYFLLAPPMSDVDRHARVGSVGLTLIISAIGFYDGFFGPGTGSFMTLTLVALGGLGRGRARGEIAGGHVLWVLGLTMAAANVAGNQIGARLAIRFGGRGIRPLLVIMSLALTAKLLLDPANPIRGLF